MSTQSFERRRIRPVGRRGELRRIGALLAVLAGVFAIAFAIGHIRRGGETVVERTPPRLSAVPTPVGASLAAAPAIKLAVAKPPPPHARTTPAKSSTTVSSTPAVATPTPTTSAPVTPAPAVQPVAPPSKPVTPATPSPSPSPRSSGGSGSGGSGSGGSGSGGSGTSFESSG